MPIDDKITEPPAKISAIKIILKWSYRILVGLGVLILVLRLADRAARSGASLPPLPQPNGYDELVSAAHAVKKPPTDFGEMTSEQVQVLSGENRPSIARARKALRTESRVSLDTKKGWQDQHDEDLKDLKRLAVAFAVEAKSEMLRGQTNEAARGSLDTVRLAQAMSRGGIFVDGINGLTIELIGTASLQSLLTHLDGTFPLEAARALEELDASRETPETVIATEKMWSTLNFGLIDRVGRLIGKETIAKRNAKFIERFRETRTRTQRLMLRLAVRAYELENQRPPSRVADLVPKYLKTIPIDLKTALPIQELPRSTN